MKKTQTVLFYGLICLALVLVVACRRETQSSKPELSDEERRAAIQVRFAEYDAKAATLPYEPIVTNEDGLMILKDANFMEAVNQGGILVVDCWMDYCIPCEDMEPIIKGLARLYQDKVQFAKLHNSNMIMTEKYGVQGFPTFLFFVDGEFSGMLVGMQPSGRMQMVIDQMLLDLHAKQAEVDSAE